MRFAVEALNKNKVRTFLSTLGITIGIFCIIMVLTMVDSLEKNVQQSVESLGKDVVFVDKWPWDFSSDYKWWKYMNRPNPKLNELRALQEKSEVAEAAAMVVSVGGAVKYKSNSAQGVNINGVSHDYLTIRNFNFAYGRYFSESESKAGEHVCILGYAIADELFGNLYPIDKEVFVKGAKFKVIGVCEKEGESLLGNSNDNIMLIPLQTVASYIRINSDRTNAQIHVKAKSGLSLTMLEDELRGIMRGLRRLKPGQEENFALNKTTLIAEPLKAVFGVITFAGWIIGGFAMLVGGFGIANIMFVSVKERTNQIGIQKALGAKNYFILIEFLFESVMLCMAGGAIGISLVWIISYWVANSIDFPIALGIGNILTGFTVSVVIGLLSGFIPALSAARLDPVVAIRAK
jgi:putative ABC transport system permease protein